MRIVFFGSDDFAVAHLDELVKSGYQVLACVTQPDKKQGRNLEVGTSLVKDFSAKNKIAVLQPATLKDASFVKVLDNFEADLFVVIAYGQFLPKEVLALPKIFSINVHGSLLPKYRGAAPINWAIINGETTTGVSIIKINEAMDAGDIIAREEVPIALEDTSLTLRAKMKTVSPKLLLKALNAIENKVYSLTKQNENEVTFAPKLTKEHGLIDWNKSAIDIHNFIRGLLPWPVAFTRYNGKTLKILEAGASFKSAEKFLPGQITGISKESLEVAAGNGVLEIRKVHLEASKPMDIKSFMAGHKLGIGFRFE